MKKSLKILPMIFALVLATPLFGDDSPTRVPSGDSHPAASSYDDDEVQDLDPQDQQREEAIDDFEERQDDFDDYGNGTTTNRQPEGEIREDE